MSTQLLTPSLAQLVERRSQCSEVDLSWLEGVGFKKNYIYKFHSELEVNVTSV